MDLKKYLKKNKIRNKDFAEKLGISRQSITNYISRKTLPSPKIALLIEKATDRQVTLEDFVK